MVKEAWKRSFSEPTHEDQVMREIITDLYDSLRTHDEALVGLLTAEESLDPDTSRQIERLFADIFAQLREMGELEADRRTWFTGEGMDLNARLLVGMVTATIAYRRWFLPTGRNRISRERLITHMTDLMLYGLRLAPPEPRDTPPTEPSTGPHPLRAPPAKGPTGCLSSRSNSM